MEYLYNLMIVKNFLINIQKINYKRNSLMNTVTINEGYPVCQKQKDKRKSHKLRYLQPKTPTKDS